MRREDVVQVWVELADDEPPRRRARRQERRSRRPWAHVALAGVALAVLAAPFGVAATGDALREGVRNGTTNRETEIIGDFNASTSGKGGYVTRQSNTQTGARAGGGAIYGCRGAAGGTAAGSAPCLRASNLANGYAFELASKSGPAGLFEVGSPSDAPFATNGGGRVVNLNADKVDGLDAAQLQGQQGPPGPKGDTGATGATGATGPRGPSDVFNAPDGAFVAFAPAFSTSRSLSLPAGNWFVTATATPNSNGAAGTTQNVDCRLLLGGTSIDEVDDLVLGGNVEAGERDALAMTGAGNLAADGTAELQCQSTGAGNVVNPSITAIRVESITTP